MHHEDFWNMRFVDYARAVKGNFEREETKWEHTRLVAALIYNSNASKGKQKRIEEIVPLKKDQLYAKERLKKAKEARKQFDKMQAEGKNTLDG